MSAGVPFRTDLCRAIARCLILAVILSATAACKGEGQHDTTTSGESTNHKTATLIGAAQSGAEGASVPANEGPWKTVQNLSYDWAGDGDGYQFTLSIPNPWNDAGDFTRLQITRRGKVVYEVTDPSGLVKYEDGIGGEMKRSAQKNLLASPYLLMISGARKTDSPTLLVFGWGYGSSPGSLRVITLAKDGAPKEALYLENFEVTGFTDLNHDSRLELVGKACFSQRFGPDLLTYDPYSVFRFGATRDAPMTLDLSLSEDYNNKNYYGWAGPECREDIAVVLHPPGNRKPEILPTKEAEALFSNK